MMSTAATAAAPLATSLPATAQTTPAARAELAAATAARSAGSQRSLAMQLRVNGTDHHLTLDP